MMKAIKITLFVIISTLSTGYGQTNPIGLWGTECKKGFLACQQVLFESDSTFKFGIFMDLGGWTFLEGTWGTSGDTIILNTFEQPKKITNNFLYSDSIKGSFLKLSLDSAKIKKVIVIINQNEVIDTLLHNQSLVINEKIKVEKITIINYDNQKEGIMIATMNSTNYFEIFTLVPPPINNNNDYLTNKKWLLKGKRIYYIRNDSGGYENSHYIKKDYKDKKFMPNK